MLSSFPQSEVGLWKPARVVQAFAVLALGFLIIVGLSAEALFGTVFISSILFTIIAVICLRGLVLGYPHKVFGACNVITTARAALVSVLAGAITTPISPWIVFGLAISAFALDGLDGWLARRAGLTSLFGARFDMEIDALLAAVLALALLSELSELSGGTAGPAILVLGFTRYAFVLAGMVWRGLKGALPSSIRRKAICCVQISALIIVGFPLTPELLIQPVSFLAAGALLWSFVIDIAFLVRHRS